MGAGKPLKKITKGETGYNKRFENHQQKTTIGRTSVFWGDYRREEHGSTIHGGKKNKDVDL